MKKLFVPALAPFLLFMGPGGIAQRGQKQQIDYAVNYAQTITPAELKEKLSIIASREMEGRETASPGQKKAAAYIESQFQKLGL